jgi:chromosome segregation ATPase
MASYQEQAPPSGSTWGSWFPPAVIIAQVLTIGGLAYIAHDLSVTRQALQAEVVHLKERAEVATNRLDNLDERSGRLKQELGVTSDQLGNRLSAAARQIAETKKTAAELAEEQKQTAAQLGTQISQVRDEAGAKVAAVTGEVGGVKTDLSATKKDLEATKSQLKSAIGDLGVQSGLIARNHDELLELKRRGERNYFEFNLTKEKQPRRIGDISIRLAKTDQKKLRYTIEVVADDKRVEKKDKTLNEPVQFYVARARIPYEIVVNEIGKDRIVGYMATPK